VADTSLCGDVEIGTFNGGGDEASGVHLDDHSYR
jgi:hypothetical protein